MRKTVVVLLTSLLLASLPVQGNHSGYPGAVTDEVPPAVVEAERVTRVAHDCSGDYGLTESGNDLASVWVGTGHRTADFDRDGARETLKLVLVDVVLGPRVDPDGSAARLLVRFSANGHEHTTVLESLPDPDPTTDDPDPPANEDWQSPDSIVHLADESNLRPLTIATREVSPGPGATTSADGAAVDQHSNYRVVELGYRFADVFSPGSNAPPEDLVIEGEWHVETSFEEDDGTFAAADVMPGDDAGCTGYENADSPALVPDAPVVTGVTATPSENVDRRPETKVRFHAVMDLGGGDGERRDYEYDWTFTNGDQTTTSTAANPEVRFTDLDAPVDVRVKVTDDLGLESNEYVFSEDPAAEGTALVTFVNHPPVSDFVIENDQVPTPGVEVTFLDRSFDPEGDDVVSWSWDFDDGSPAVTTQNAEHAFPGVGVYDVTLTVTDEHHGVGGREGIDSHVLRVFVCEEAEGAGCKPPNAGPQASFEASAMQVTRGETVAFTDTSTDRDGTIESWSWDFGDGATSTQQDPEHTFDRVGTFHVTLTVTDDGGLQGVRALPVRVVLPEPEEPEDEAELLPPPIAAFTVDPEEPVVGQEIRFRDATSSQTEIARWTWFFGDGSSAVEGRDVSHAYEESGTFRVRLTVTDEHGVRDTTDRTVVVGSGETDEEAPGLPVALLLASLAAVAVAARRRR